VKTLILTLLLTLLVGCGKDNPVTGTPDIPTIDSLTTIVDTMKSHGYTEYYVKTGQLLPIFPDYDVFHWAIYTNFTDLDSCLIQVSVKPPDTLYLEDSGWREPRWSIFDSGTIYIYNDNYIDWKYRIVIGYIEKL
jgi:hypothetical protein